MEISTMSESSRLVESDLLPLGSITPSSNVSSKPEHASAPLLLRLESAKPPLAKSEIDDLSSDGNSVATAPYPGIDDGFFESNPKTNPDAENIPKDLEGMEPHEKPHFRPRAGGDDDDDVDAPDGSEKPPQYPAPPRSPYPGAFPYAPGFGHDLEVGSMPDLDSIPDVNVYQHKKTLAQGMMDLALFSANANQLRYVIESFSRHPYYYPSVILISLSLLLQVAIGIGLIWNATYNVKNDKEICVANKINNFTVIGIFLVTVINVFISAFGVANMNP